MFVLFYRNHCFHWQQKSRHLWALRFCLFVLRFRRGFLFCLPIQGLFLLCYRLEPRRVIVEHYCSQFFMFSLYLNSTSPPFARRVWSTFTTMGGVFFLALLMLGLSTWLALIKGTWAEVTSVSDWGLKRRCLFLLPFLHSCDLSGTELCRSILFSLGPIINTHGADLNPTHRLWEKEMLFVSKFGVVCHTALWQQLLTNTRPTCFTSPDFHFLIFKMRPSGNQRAQLFFYPCTPKGSGIYPMVTETKYTSIKYCNTLKKDKAWGMWIPCRN